MIGPRDVRLRAERRYSDYLSALVEGRSIFPMDIPFAKVKPGEAAARWSELGREILELRYGSSESKPGTSYEISWEERRDRLAGAQRLPAHVKFSDEASYLAFLGKTREVRKFRSDLAALLEAFPDLRPWAAAKPRIILERSGEWPRIAGVLAWFRDNPASGLYLREVPAVEDTKFIEARKALIRSLLDLVAPLPAGSRAPKTFEERCGLRSVQNLVRIRILDPALAADRFAGLDDLALPLDCLAALDVPEIERVLVIENKASFGSGAEVFLTAPAMRGTLAVFGSGGAAHSLGVAVWLASRRLGYWGDIDTQGLRILGGFRAAFPEAESILMDEKTFDRFPDYRTDAPPDEAREPENLRPAEMSLFRRLISLPSGNRLEQERIPNEFARQRLLDWAGGGPTTGLDAT